MAKVDWEAIARGSTNGGTAPRKRTWDGCNLRFFMLSEPNQRKSDEAGRLICDEIECIEVWPPGGDRTPVKLEEHHRQEYKPEYDRWKATLSQPESGTPLTEWTPLPKSACMELNYLGIKTVEQLAEANDEVKRKIGPMMSFCKKAKEWLKAADSKQADVTALREQLEREQKRTAKLEEQIGLLISRIESNEGTRYEGMKNGAS